MPKSTSSKTKKPPSIQNSKTLANFLLFGQPDNMPYLTSLSLSERLNLARKTYIFMDRRILAKLYSSCFYTPISDVFSVNMNQISGLSPMKTSNL